MPLGSEDRKALAEELARADELRVARHSVGLEPRRRA